MNTSKEKSSGSSEVSSGARNETSDGTGTPDPILPPVSTDGISGSDESRLSEPGVSSRLEQETQQVLEDGAQKKISSLPKKPDTRSNTSTSMGDHASLDVDRVQGSDDLILSKLINCRLGLSNMEESTSGDHSTVRDAPFPSSQEASIPKSASAECGNNAESKGEEKHPASVAASTHALSETYKAAFMPTSSGDALGDPNTIPAGVPGAYALAPLNENPTGSNGHNTEPHQAQVPPPVLDPTLESSNTPVANAIADNSGERTLPEAIEEDLEAQEERTNQRKKKSKQIAALVLALFLVVLGVILAVTLVMKSNNQGATIDLVPTSPPTEAPSLYPSLRVELHNPLHLFSDYTNQALENPDSPQSQAYQWLLEDLYLHNDSLPDDRILQRFALATLYYATVGDDWSNNRHWLNHSIHECHWFAQGAFLAVEDKIPHAYVHTNNPNPCEMPGEALNQSTAVTSPHNLYTHLWLHSNELQGTIPPEVYELIDLRSLSLHSNKDLVGTISSHIGQLTKVEAIHFGGSLISGALPTELGLLSNSLQSIATINANLDGTIPSELGLLDNLHDLLVDQNSFSGTIPPELGNASNLKWIYFAENLMTGTIPLSLLGLPLEQLYLAMNDFSGTLHTEIGLLPNLYRLAMYRNSLTGTIPTQIGLATNLEVVFFDSNSLAGTLPTELGLLKRMTRLYAHYNQNLSGTIPTELGACAQLEVLLFMHSALTGRIPSEMGLIPGLIGLDLGYNQLTGTIPTDLGQAPFHSLSLDNNYITGTIPDELGPELWRLRLQENPLTGTIPGHLDFADPNHTVIWFPTTFNITGTQLNGTIPDALCATELLDFECSPFLCGCSCSCLGGYNDLSQTNDTTLLAVNGTA